MQVHQVLQVLMVQMVLQDQAELQVMQVHQDLQVLMVHRVLEVVLHLIQLLDMK